MARGTTIWAIATEDNFKRKLQDTDRWGSDGQCRAASFDPCRRRLARARDLRSFPGQAGEGLAALAVLAKSRPCGRLGVRLGTIDRQRLERSTPQME